MHSTQNKNREGFKSKWGFILAAAGSAVGLGNLWRFPKEVGSNGGGAFVFFYLVFILLIGSSMVLAEFTVGRRGRSHVVDCYGRVAEKFKFAGYLGMFAVILLLSFYAIIGGWTIYYTFQAASGTILNLPAHELENVFHNLVSDTHKLFTFQVLFLIATAFIVSQGIAGGIEKYCKVLMPTLFIIMIGMAVRSVTLPGAWEGVLWYLKPDFSAINSSVIVSALGQAFFSLSLGSGAMVTYASYLDKDVDLGSTALSVTLADTAVALLAGFIIIPAVFAFDLEVSTGPGLVFITLPQVFSSLPFGQILATAFFFLLFIAALTSSISMLEVAMSFLEDKVKINRKQLTWISTLGVLVLGIPPLLSFGPWNDIRISGRNFMDAYDYIVSNLSIPLVALLTSILLGFFWKKEDVIDEATSGGLYNVNRANLWYCIIRYLVPVLLFVIYIQALGILKI